jgi:hypothetical protein
MVRWKFYLAQDNEWRWCQLDDIGLVRVVSEKSFEQLEACMRNAQCFGFDQYQDFEVDARKPGNTSRQ